MLNYVISNRNIHIVNSYQVTDEKEMKHILENILKEAKALDVHFTRSMNSYIKEWVVHNWMYEHNIFKSRTIHVDLSENEPQIRLIAYNILYPLCKKRNK